MAPPGSRRAQAHLHPGVTCATKKAPKSAAAEEAAEGEDTSAKAAESPAEAKPKRAAAKSKKAAKPEAQAVAPDAVPKAAPDAAPDADADSTAQYGDYVEVSTHYRAEVDSPDDACHRGLLSATAWHACEASAVFTLQHHRSSVRYCSHRNCHCTMSNVEASGIEASVFLLKYSESLPRPGCIIGACALALHSSNPASINALCIYRSTHGFL